MESRNYGKDGFESFMKQERRMKRFREKRDFWRLGRREKPGDSEMLSLGEWVNGDVIITGTRISSRRSRLG